MKKLFKRDRNWKKRIAAGALAFCMGLHSFFMPAMAANGPVFGFSSPREEVTDETAAAGEAATASRSFSYKGPDYTVNVTCEEAAFPEGTVLSVREIRENAPALKDQQAYREYLDQAGEALKLENSAVKAARFFDIRFRLRTEKGWTEVEPTVPVDVQIEYKNAVALENGTAVKAVHLPEGADNAVLEARINEPAGTTLETASTGSSDDGVESTENEAANDAGVQETEADAPAAAPASVESVSFLAESFSVYGIVYTVDFWYGEYAFSIPGGSSILLSSVLDRIGMAGTDMTQVRNVSFTDDSLIAVEKVTDEEQVPDGDSYIEGDWLLTSLQPFQSEEKLTVEMPDKVLEIRVTDAYIPVPLDPVTEITKIGKDMDISGITIRDLSGRTAGISYDTSVFNEGTVAGVNYIRWNGTLPKAESSATGITRLDGEISLTYKKAAYNTFDNRDCDVVFTFSNFKLYGDVRTAVKGDFRLLSPAEGSVPLPSISTGIDNAEAGVSNPRYGVEMTVDVRIVDSETKSVVPESFIVTVWDLNLNREVSNGADSFKKIYEASSHYNFSEYVRMSGNVYYLADENENETEVRLTVNGNDIVPKSKRSGGNNSYATGVATVADNGTYQFTAFNGGGAGTNTNYYLMPRGGICHTITSYSGFGGTIETSTTGAFAGTYQILPGGTIAQKKTYEVPAGKDVTYRFRPENGEYSLNKLYVDGAVETPTMKDGWYYYTFPDVSEPHKINVSWTKNENIELTFGHIGVKTDGSLLDLQSAAVDSGYAVTTNIPANGDPKKFGEGGIQAPSDLTLNNVKYNFASYSLGDEDAVSTHIEAGGSPYLWIRYTENGQFEYSEDQEGDTWHIWNSAGDGKKPVVYAFYTFAGGENEYYVPVTVMAGAEGLLIDDTDPSKAFTYEYTISEQKWKLEAVGGTMTAVKKGDAVVSEPRTFSLHPNSINTILLKYTEVKDGDSTSEITTQSITVRQTAEPAGFVKKTGADYIKYQVNGRPEEEPKAGSIDSEGGEPVSFTFDTARKTIKVSETEAGSGKYNIALKYVPKGTDVEFYNRRETVQLKLAKKLNDPSMSDTDKKDFTFTVRLRESHAHGEHLHMLGSYTIKNVKKGGSAYPLTGETMYDEDGNAVSAIKVPKGVDVLVIERWSSEEDRYITNVEGPGVYKEADREYMVSNIQADATVTYTNTLKPRTVTVKKELINGDSSALFSFSALITDANDAPVSGYPVYTDDNGVVHYTDSAGKYVFSITGSGEQPLKVPVGGNITVTEDDPDDTEKGYSYDVYSDLTGSFVEYDAAGPYSATLTNVLADRVLTFRNVETNVPVCQVIDVTGETETFIKSYTTLQKAFEDVGAAPAGTDFRIEMLVENYLYDNPNGEYNNSIQYRKSGQNITLTTAPENSTVAGAYSYRGATGTACTIINNRPTLSSMIMWDTNNTAGTLTIENVSFDGNGISSDVSGGMLLVTGGAKVILREGAVIRNFVSKQGGAVYVANGTLEVDGASILNNTAEGGSAILASGSSARLIMKGGTVTGNKTTQSGAHGAIETKNGYTLRIELSGPVYVLGNTNRDGEACNIVLNKDQNTELRIVGDLEDEAKVGIWSVQRSAADADFGIAMKADEEKKAEEHYSGYYHLKNDRNPQMVGIEGTLPAIKWMGAIARVSNDEGDTWTYHDKLSSTQWVNQRDNHLHGAFDQASLIGGDVIVELLLESHPLYTIASEHKFSLDKDNLSVTLRTTPDSGWNPNGFTSTIYRGWNGSGTDNTALFYVNNASAKLKTENIILDGTWKNNTGYTGRAVYVNSGEVCFAGGTTVQNFHTAAAGGAVYVGNAGKHMLIDNSSNGNVVFSNCGNEISNSNDDGGAIFSKAEVSITGNGKTTFTNCKANGNGGAIYAGGNVTINPTGGTSFINCAAADSGGAVYNDGTLSSTTLQNVSITGSTARLGAAVYSQGILTIRQSDDGTSKIENCSASDANGGAVQVGNNGKMIFEGNAVVYGNPSTGTATGSQKNVVLDQDNNTTINTTAAGLGADAKIGVYVTGTMPSAAGTGGTAPFVGHGREGDPFGTYGKGAEGSYEGDFRYFINDRLSKPASGTSEEKLVRGVKKKDADTMYWDNVTLSITKTVDGGMGDKTKEFAFTVSGLKPASSVEWKKQEKTSADGTWQDLSTGGSGTFTVNGEGKVTFGLKHWQKMDLVIPAGTEVTVTEKTDYYTATFSAFKTDSTTTPKEAVDVVTLPKGKTGKDVNGARLTAEENTTLSVTNTLEQVSPTGVAPLSRAFLLILLLLGGAGFLMMILRRRKDTD